MINQSMPFIKKTVAKSFKYNKEAISSTICMYTLLLLESDIKNDSKIKR